jgi:hypothetical protein
MLSIGFYLLMPFPISPGCLTGSTHEGNFTLSESDDRIFDSLPITQVGGGTSDVNGLILSGRRCRHLRHDSAG